MPSDKDKVSYEKKSISESFSSKPLFRNIVTRLQIASRLSRARRNSLEEENDVVADDHEIKHFARQISSKSPKRPPRPKSLTIRQLSKLSDGSNRNIFNRAESKLSDGSFKEEDEYENGIICDGIIYFRKQFAYDEGHPYMKVKADLDVEHVAKIMHQCWDLVVPKIVTFVISSKSHSTNWTNQRQIKNFQKGLMKAAISTNMWIFTNAINSGAAKLIGNAIKNETFKMKIKRTLDKQNLTNLIGVIREEDLKYGELLGANDRDKINIENEGISYGTKFELNEDHTHYIVIRDARKYNISINTFITRLIGLLIKGSVIDSVDSQSRIASTPDSLDSPIASIEATEVPVVSILIEGDNDCAQLVLDLIKSHIPVVILRGSGGLADMIAFAYLEILHRCSDLNLWDSEFVEEYLKPMLSKKIISCCNDLRDNTLARNILRDRIIECVRLSKVDGRTYLTILNMHNSSSCNLENLSEHLLLALLKSRQSTEMVSTDNFLKDLELTMDWNCAHVAKDVIFAKNVNNITKLDKSKFESALIRPNREEFVDLFLTLGFQLHKFLSPSRLNRLFKLIYDKEFYQTLCWESVLGRSSNAKHPKYFIENDLNWLIEILTGLENFVNTEHLHLNVIGLYPIDSLSAERKALTLLTMWAVMHNRHKLAQVFWKHSDQPVHLALVISMMFERLSLYALDNNMKSELKQKSKAFADYANGVLDACYIEDVSRANNVLNESISDWNFKTAVDIAANAHLRQFLAHPCCQKWLTNTFLGNIRLRELSWGFFTIPPAIKILLCAFFIFPMYIWVRFKVNEQEINENHNKEEEFDDIYDDMFYKVGERSESITNENTVNSTTSIGFTNPAFSRAAESIADNFDRIRERSKNHYNIYIRDREVFVRKQPPLWEMIPMMWCSPITKFYTSQIFYMLFLPLLSLSVIYPSCGLWKLDVLVCGWATLIVISYIRRTYILCRKYTSVPVFVKCIEILSIITFIILFALTRVFNIPVYSPYTQKIVLSLGVLYFYYRLISIYLPISPTLGPLLHRLKLMITVDFVNYMRIALLVIVSNGIVMQAILYPDTEISFETFRRAFHRAFFSLFMAPVSELEMNQNCETNQINHRYGDIHQCDITGRYNSTSCANHGVWAYIFVTQYFIFLKLILSTLLLAIFAATASKLQTETDNIWKFQRYLLVIDFAHRLPLPAPFSLIHYIYFIYQYFNHCFCKCNLCCCKKNKKVIISSPNELQEQYRLTNDECIYWRQLASSYIDEQQAKSAKDQIPIKEWECVQTISEDIEYEKKILRDIKGKVRELERAIYSEHFSNKSSHNLKSYSPDLKSTLSRHSPYPGTRVIRVPLSDKYIPWEVMHIEYEPVAYTKPKSEFSPKMQLWVDDDILLMKELQMRNSSIRVKFPNFHWNSSEVNPAGLAINRMSWQINDNGSALYYKLEDNLIPRNPFGRTGLRGRGDFPRWGPNHYVMFVITRWQKQSSSSLSNNKNLEFIIEKIENSDQDLLPERFVSGDDLFGDIQKLFKVETKTCWVLPEVVNFFKKSCLSQETDDFSFKLIRNGYIDDPMNTDNAWKEAKIWHIHYDCREYLRKRLDQSSLSWRPLSDSLFAKLPLSHTYIIKSVVDTLNANFI